MIELPFIFNGTTIYEGKEQAKITMVYVGNSPTLITHHNSTNNMQVESQGAVWVPLKHLQTQKHKSLPLYVI